MRTRYGIKNFRVFDEKGVSLEIKPITILTGANSSGKSSLVKSMMVFNDYLERLKNKYQIEGRFDPASEYLIFAGNDLKLASFESVKNYNSKGSSMTFSYDVALPISPIKFSVDYVFDPAGDKLGRGRLAEISVYSERGEVLKACFSNDGLSVPVLDLTEIERDFPGILNSLRLYELRDSIWRDESLYDENGQLDTEKVEECYPEYFQRKNYGSASFGEEFHDFTKNEKNKAKTLLEYNLIRRFKCFDNTFSLCYFPVFEKFVGLDKQQSVALIRSVTDEYVKKTAGDRLRSMPDVCHHISKWGEEVASLFENSEFDDFRMFYTSLEDYKIGHMIYGKGVLLMGEKYDLLGHTLHDAINVSFDYIGPMSLFGVGTRDEKMEQFHKIYNFLSAWQWAESPEDSDTYISRYFSVDYEGEYYRSDHILYKAFTEYVEMLIPQILLPMLRERMEYAGNSFTSVQRLHSLEENSPFVKSVKDYFELSNALSDVTGSESYSFHAGQTKEKSYAPGEFMNRWLQELEIGRSVDISVDDEGMGVKVSLVSMDGHTVSLADEGHGVTQIIAILLKIEAEILKRKCNEAGCSRRGIKYENNRQEVALVFEEPEVSLHPAVQSKLAMVFKDAYEQYGIHFIIETHSEYLIRRTQAVVASYKTKQEFDSNPFVVYYLDKAGTLYNLEYSESGRFKNSFGPGFFDEASRWSLEILRKEEELRKQQMLTAVEEETEL